MPVIYQGRCTACNATTAQLPEGCLAVHLDAPPPEVKEHLHPQNPNLVLIHPLDEDILDRLGESTTTAAEEGRLLWIENVLCRGCGRHCELRRLSTDAAAFGIVTTLVVVLFCIGAGLGVAYLAGNNWPGWIMATATVISLWTVLYIVLTSSADRQVRSQHTDRVEQFENPAKCPHCGSGELGYLRALREPIPCVACGARKVKVECVGIA